MRQWYCFVGQQQYGPITDDVLRDWARTGRVTAKDNVWTEGMPNWAPAGTVGGLFAGAPAAGAYVRPHRSGAVLALGILGLVVCLICGIIAWVMGSGDLREMRAGRMDRSGESMTRAGMICGIVSVIINAAGFLLWVLVLGLSGL